MQSRFKRLWLDRFGLPQDNWHPNVIRHLRKLPFVSPHTLDELLGSLFIKTPELLQDDTAESTILMADAFGWCCLSLWQGDSVFPSFPESYALFLKDALFASPAKRPADAESFARTVVEFCTQKPPIGFKPLALSDPKAVSLITQHPQTPNNISDQLEELVKKRTVALKAEISERSQTEQALRESEKRFRDLLQEIPSIAVQGYGPDGTTQYWNKASEQIYGYSAQEAIGRNLIDLIIPPEMRPDVKRAIQGMAESGQAIPASELLLMRKDGSRVPVFSSHAIIKTPGRPQELFCIDIDLSAQKRTEQALRESEERLSLALAASKDGVWEWNPETGEASYSKVNLLGYSQDKDAPNNRDWLALVHPDDKQAVRNAKLDCIENRCDSFEISFRIRAQDGAWHWLLARGKAAGRDSQGRALRMVGTYQDITERKLAEEALRQSEEIHRVAFEMAPVGMAYVSPQGRVLKVNAKYCDIVGYTEAELAELTVFDITHPDDRTKGKKEYAAYVRKECLVHSLEKRYLRKDGTERWVSVVARMVHKPNGQPLHSIGFIQDITELKHAEENRIVLGKLESTGILAGGIAHDFNNLLNAILLNVDLAQSPQNSPRTRAHLETVRNSALAAQNLTKQLITFAKGGAPVQKSVRLNNVILSSVNLCLSGSNVQAKVHVDSDLHWTLVDEGQIGQVIRNLLLNARDSMTSGGIVSLEAQNISIPSQESQPLPPGNYVRVSVSDQGQGIPAEKLSKIFDPYYSTKPRGDHKGMGLGLTICHTIIQKHQGLITVQSKLGTGTTFQFYLPACQQATPPDPAQESTSPQPAPRRRKVLVMDDEDCMRIAVSSVLEGQGMEVLSAGNGNEAIDLYLRAMKQGVPFDAVILDLTVRGGMGGKETVAELHKADPNVRAIVMSGYSEDPVLVKPQRYGFRAGMEKSFDVEHLMETLARVLEG